MATQEQNIGKIDTHSAETASGERFEFGKNWNRLLAHLDDQRINEAEESLKQMLEEQYRVWSTVAEEMEA